MPRVFGDQHGRDHRLGGQAALDQPLGRRRLNHRIECVKFCKWRSWVSWGLGGFSEVSFLVLPEVVHVEVAVGFEPVFVGLDG